MVFGTEGTQKRGSALLEARADEVVVSFVAEEPPSDDAERVEKAVALLADVRAYLVAHKAINQHDNLDEGLSCGACELLGRIEGVCDGEDGAPDGAP